MDHFISVWLANGVPARLVWQRRRFRVNDTPTRISAADIWWHPAMTHPPADDWLGWRFQAVDDAGLAGVFDVRQLNDGRWTLLGWPYDYQREEAVDGDRAAAVESPAESQRRR